MAYKYFTQKLLSQDILDLNQVFPEKQEQSRISNNVSYSLADIAVFLQDRTENFKRIEPQYVDIDNAINEIVNKYYKSQGVKNPFVDDLDEEAMEELINKNPRQAAVVKEGKIESKAAPKAPPERKGKDKTSTEPEKKPKASKKISAQEKEIREELDAILSVFDLQDEADKKELIEAYEIEAEGIELLIEDDEEMALRYKILTEEFIPELKKLL